MKYSPTLVRTSLFKLFTAESTGNHLIYNSKIHKKVTLRRDVFKQYRVEIDRLQLAENVSQEKRCEVLDNLFLDADNRLGKVSICVKPFEKTYIKDKETCILLRSMSELNRVKTSNIPAIFLNHENIKLFLEEFEACLDDKGILYKKSPDEANGTLVYEFD